MSAPLPYGLDNYNITFKRVPTNGIELNVAEAGQGPVVFLLHGFPEGWATWGPQIKFLVDKGYKVVAPEMRGFGDSDAPESVEAYDTLELAADVAGLVDAYREEMGEEKGVVIGHDWGCIVAWYTAWLHPEKIKGIGGLSVPWFGRGEIHFLDALKGLMGDKYFYIVDFQRDAIDEQLNADHHETLTHFLTGEMDLLAMEHGDMPVLERISLPESAPDYMPQDFLDYTTSRYSRHGFRPSLNWYRNFERTWERTAGRSDVIEPPAMFLAGSKDWPQIFAKNIGLDLNLLFKDLRINAEVEAGHWLGQEKADWANEHIAEFLKGLGH